MILILDFGSQYTQLIARRIRELGCYAEILPFHAPLPERSIHGIILSGGPRSVYDKDAPLLNPSFFSLDKPILGICYGMQLMSHALGGKVVGAEDREYGPAQLIIKKGHPLFKETPREQKVWMSHGDRIEELPPGFIPLASTANTPYAAMANDARQLYGVQFHPEVHHTAYGKTILDNFLNLIQAPRTWDMASYAEKIKEEIKEKVGDEHEAIAALSGGVDSTVAATLVAEVMGKRLHGIFVDTGLLRKGEVEEVKNYFSHYLLDLKVIDAKARFFQRLQKYAIHPKRKRKIIGHTFIEVFEREAKRLPKVKYLVQGTLYPDVIESVSLWGPSSTIKIHHNVGGLPKKLKLHLIEPLRFLFKDEVRKLGKALGVPENILKRHPFPGPGLAVRILGKVTPERVAILQKADAIFIEELRAKGWYDRVSQAFAVLLPVKSVGVMGDEGTYEYVCALRAVTTEDFMTADFSSLPHDLLRRVASRIVNEIKGVGRVVYDITTKPPATIEWE